MTYDADAGIARAHALATRLNRQLHMADADEALAAIAALISGYLMTCPVEEREAELEDWLRLVRSLSEIGPRLGQ